MNSKKMYFLAGTFTCVKEKESYHYQCDFRPPIITQEELNKYDEKYRWTPDIKYPTFYTDNLSFDGATSVKVDEWTVKAEYMQPSKKRVCEFIGPSLNMSPRNPAPEYHLLACGLSVEEQDG